MALHYTTSYVADSLSLLRHYKGEFMDPPRTRAALMAMWEEGWALAFRAFESLSEQDLARTVTIRGEAHSVMQAINRQLAHYAYHCGQIVFLAKHLQHAHWRSLSIPRGGSQAFDAAVRRGAASQR